MSDDPVLTGFVSEDGDNTISSEQSKVLVK